MPGAAAAQAPEATPLPEAITAWRVEQFKQARREGHPKFIDAVRLLGRQFAGTSVPSDRAATLLARLLKSENPSGAVRALAAWRHDARMGVCPWAECQRW
jgi:hypothetical protein